MPKNYIPIAIQKEVFQRSKGYCEYCLLPASFSPNAFNFEHIIPISKNGLTEISNIAYSCGGCNAYKNDKIESIDPLQCFFFRFIILLPNSGRSILNGAKMIYKS